MSEHERLELQYDRQLRGQHQRLVGHALAAHIHAQAARREVGRGAELCRRQVVEDGIGDAEVGDREVEGGARIADRAAHLQARPGIAGQGRRAEFRQLRHRQILQGRIERDLPADHRGIGA